MELVLYEPEIPPNTGNVARLCAATDTLLHLIEPLGFRLEDRYLRRAGLDYWPNVRLAVWPDWESWLAAAREARGGRAPRCVMTSARGGTPLHRFAFEADDCLVMGPETRGLPAELLARGEAVRIPMKPGGVRSINMSTAAGIVLYAALASCGRLDAPGWC
ncbi:tRNA (cytidine(34)-2'-O)-methyltransferase [uncultured Desulfovibrio sp.]|uniref:tRNA (cytidine(34)-2'-O)-methyltransferase n=1 Tax=uncultured Desulfovibrio sp. TaxID=167968 RepID=UPI002635C0D4|nr:tRNA (cytidine(34)-2'-O)-methyltransferase [uncultured Desulfovibrio sp.]